MPIGATRSITRGVLSFCGPFQPTVGIERRQIVEIDSVPDRLGRLEIHVLQLEQSKIPLAILRRTDLAFHGVAGA
jgi:hypothetical protein